MKVKIYHETQSATCVNRSEDPDYCTMLSIFPIVSFSLTISECMSLLLVYI